MLLALESRISTKKPDSRVARHRQCRVVPIVRDRVHDLIGEGMMLAQIKAARPSLDFDGRYGSTTGPWRTDMFIEAVYRSLQGKK